MSKLLNASKHLIKGNIGKAFNELTQTIVPGRYRGGNYFFGINGADTAYIWKGEESNLHAYKYCPPVSSIINNKAQCRALGKVKITNKNGKESQTILAKSVRKLFSNPNDLQSAKEFTQQLKLVQQIYGYCPIYVVKPLGYQNDPSTWKMYILYPWTLTITDKMGMPYKSDVKKFESIVLNINGVSTQLPVDDVFFIKESQFSTASYIGNNSGTNNSINLPDSKLKNLTYPISNIIDGYNSRNSVIVNRGPQWIMTNDTNDSADAGMFPVDPKVKQDLKNDLARYGSMDGQMRGIVTDGKYKLQTVGFDMSQMKLHEEEVQSAKAICDGLNYPAQLLGLLDPKYDNMQVAERRLFQNAIIPDAVSECEQWAYYLGLEAEGSILEIDFSHLHVFAEDKLADAKSRLELNKALLIEWENELLTWNQWQEKLGNDIVIGMDIYRSEFVKQGKLNNNAKNTNTAEANSGAVIEN